MKKIVMMLGALPFMILSIVTMGLSLSLPSFFINWSLNLISNFTPVIKFPLLGLSLAAAFYLYGFSLIFIAPFINFILNSKLKPFRGASVSLGCLRWYIHNTLTMIVRYSFLEFITPTAFASLYYRMMGMKIGKNVTINSTAIADPSMIQLGDNVVIGGSANIMAHYAQGSVMVITPVKIRNNATIGLRASLMGGVEVGERSIVLANSFVLPNTKIPPKETWGGVPAVRVNLQDYKQELFQ
jgi:acetyltransferase-like isoleucine patch superfamily enzyme